MTELIRDLDIPTNGQPHDTWTPLNLNTLPDKPPVQPNLANTNLIYPGLRHVFSGPPESAKTLAAYAVLIQNARHGMLGILIDFEMGPYDARTRLRELGATSADLDLIAYLHPDIPATQTHMLALAATHPHLVVLDASVGAFELQGLDDNKRADAQKLATLYVGVFWEHRIATITIDHVVKNAQERGRFQIGSERKLGGTDVHIGFDTIKPISRGTTGHYKLIVHKDRGGYHKRGHLADLKLDSDPDTHQIEWAFTDPQQTTGEAGYFRPTHLMEKASISLETRSEPVTRTTVYEDLRGTKDYVLKAIDALVREGFVAETDGPSRSKLLTSIGRYREATDEPQDPSRSVVRTWFDCRSEPRQSKRGIGGSDLCTTYIDPTEPLAAAENEQEQPEWFGWFDDNGSYLDTIAPDPTEDE